MNGEPDQTKPSEPGGKKKSPALALSLAFLPSGMFLGLLTAVMGPGSRIDGKLWGVACFVSIVCCFASAFMLFLRNTTLAIIAGVVFLLLNSAISLLLGCGASLSNAKL